MVIAPRHHSGKLRPKNRRHIPETSHHIDENIIQADIQNETDATYKNKTGNFFLTSFFEPTENVQCLFSR